MGWPMQWRRNRQAALNAPGRGANDLGNGFPGDFASYRRYLKINTDGMRSAQPTRVSDPDHEWSSQGGGYYNHRSFTLYRYPA